MGTRSTRIRSLAKPPVYMTHCRWSNTFETSSQHWELTCKKWEFKNCFASSIQSPKISGEYHVNPCNLQLCYQSWKMSILEIRGGNKTQSDWGNKSVCWEAPSQYMNNHEHIGKMEYSYPKIITQESVGNSPMGKTTRKMIYRVDEQTRAEQTTHLKKLGTCQPGVSPTQ